MKNNLPITQTEVFPSAAKPIVSKTDLKGSITYANDSFIAISGFSREELVGHNHNVVRHPDMPPEAFADLWNTIKGGHPWRGLVKNRCKNGDFYWVEAYVTPITEHGRTVGYMSVRNPPARAEINAAEALYRQVRNKSATLPATPTKSKSIVERIETPLTVITAALALGGGIAGNLYGLGWGLACGGLAAVLTLGLLWLNHQRVRMPLQRAHAALTAIHEGRLKEAITDDDHRLGGLLSHLESLRINLRAMFADVLISARTVDEQAQQLDQHMREINSNLQEQSGNVMGVSASMEQMSTSIEESSARMDMTLTSTREAQTLADDGITCMQQGITGTERVVDIVTRASTELNEMHEEVLRIGDITSVIKEIADQTNLLALNAAIEAARAGESGRGFAVVADEVRKLSERTALSTAEIGKVIDNVTQRSAGAVKTMEMTAQEVATATDAIRRSRDSLASIHAASNRSLQLADDVTHMLGDQAATSHQVAQAMENIARAEEGSAQRVSDVSANAVQLRATAAELRALIRHLEHALQ